MPDRSFDFLDIARRAEAQRADELKSSRVGKPWRLMVLTLGRPQVEASFDTEDAALTHLRQMHSTCAPFIRDAIWVEGPNKVVHRSA